MVISKQGINLSDVNLSGVSRPERILLGPGPSDVSPRVLQALARPTIGHLDPDYLELMDETCEQIRKVFQTNNRLTMAVSGTGSAGMEACICNLVEPGDDVIVCVNGVFGGRMKDVAERYGANVHVVERDWGQIFSSDDIAQAIEKCPGFKFLAIVHAETSTGAFQPLDEISTLVHDANGLLLVDAVTSLGGMHLNIDELGIDACYSGTQKCLSCPPGLSPVTFSSQAEAAMDRRKSKVTSWYLDMSMLRNYWGSDRVYHHTAPINMTFALNEALKLILEEGLENRIARHETHHLAFRAGAESLGLEFIPESSLTTLNAVSVPEGVNDAGIRRRLLDEYGIEIGAGLGPFKGKAWRVGLMGESSKQRNVVLLLSALETLLTENGLSLERGAAIAAANEVYSGSQTGIAS